LDLEIKDKEAPDTARNDQADFNIENTKRVEKILEEGKQLSMETLPKLEKLNLEEKQKKALYKICSSSFSLFSISPKSFIRLLRTSAKTIITSLSTWF
jgi:hypothetical protein